MDPLEEVPTKLAPVPVNTAPHTVQEYIKLEGPDEIPLVRKYSRVKFQTEQFMKTMQEENIYVIASIMT